MEKTLGGDRLGSGKKLKVHLHGYERSTHDMGYIWRSTMAAGTLVPFISEIALPGDTFDINLDCDIKTHPTVGPLFGSFKVQLDVFAAPIRLYQGLLHNNKLGIGMNMSSVKLPQITLGVKKYVGEADNIDNSQINPSSILAYLGIRGVGNIPSEISTEVTRDFNAIPLLAYWEIYKNYYANKQEEIGAVIHSGSTVNETIDSIEVDGQVLTFNGGTSRLLVEGTIFTITYTGAKPLLGDIIVDGTSGSGIYMNLESIAVEIGDTGTVMTAEYQFVQQRVATGWRYRSPSDTAEIKPEVTTFPLTNIDEMREALLAHNGATAFKIPTQGNLTPYNYLTGINGSFYNKMNTQEGLGIKTYQSDMFNNWLSTEWIDGAGGITELTAIDTTSGEFTLDTLLLAKKVYNMLNRIAVSGGSYDDWIDAVYTHDRYTRQESPAYVGGLIKELVFQEVVSNAEGADQALGTLGGRGVLGKKHKGGYVHINVDEPSYIIGIVSLTPRIDYSQGNKWDIHLKTMDDLHKPALDEIGFQELITEQLAWWDTTWNDTSDVWEVKSAGKQPAWLNYMTNVNRVYGNFAIPSNEMFMTLNRRYEADAPVDNWTIGDLTTYIDPSKFNHIFAETQLDAQNFWTQIAVDITARRKMSAKIMPNL